MARRTRKPNTPQSAIVQAIFESSEGSLTAGELGVVPARLNRMVKAGVLTERKDRQRVTNEDGSASRGRPRKLFGLSKSVRAKARRAAKSAA